MISREKINKGQFASSNKHLQSVGHTGRSAKANTLSRVVDGIRDHFFGMYMRSFEQELLKNNKVFITLLLFFKQLQILSLLFIPQVS